MKTEQRIWKESGGWISVGPSPVAETAELVMIFGSTTLLNDGRAISGLRSIYPSAKFIGCSTAGEILSTSVTDDTVTATAVHFDSSRFVCSKEKIGADADSFRTGQTLAKSFDPKELVHVLVLSDGLRVNGSQLVKGLVEHLPANVTVTGGLAGDGTNFQRTLVLCDDKPETDAVIAVGFYGKRLKVGFGSLGGWDPFGPERLITRSKGNVLYELDGRSALELYKEYLGEHASGLPATGLLFPLALHIKDLEMPVVRTILGVDESENSMTFAGDIPQGIYARFMRANFDRLIDGACGAAGRSRETLGRRDPELAILISCVGRKLVLKQRVEEEVEGVRAVLGAKAALAGFYSYGELSPFRAGAPCELHNQTMTITTFVEG